MTTATQSVLDTTWSAADRASFERLMGDTQRRAFSMALQLTRNRSDAEDLLQDTFVKAWRGFDSYVPGRPFLNWLLRIMQRAYLDSKRRDNPVRKAESLHAMVSPSDGDLQEMPIADTRSGPDEDLFRAELHENLHFALADLPQLYRDAIKMCDIDGCSYSEIADAQNTTVGTVRSRIHRGRKLLRDVLLKRCAGIMPATA
jgi:RNA polymerase sigma-70 factor (ECF subfamily)